MKTRSLQSLVLTIATVTAVTLWAGKAAAQESSTSTTVAAQRAAASQAAPQLSYGVSDVVQLAHANVSEDVILNYVKNSGNAYGLDAGQILYLKQQGVSDRIINTMLDQRSRLAAVQTASSQNNSGANNAPTATVITQPSVSYVQTALPSTVYVIPDTQTYNYYAYSYPYYYRYPYYGWYGWPAVSLSFGWGGYYGGYHGYYGGWHGGGGGGGGGYHGGGGGGGYHGGGGGPPPGGGGHGGGGGPPPGGGGHGGGGHR